MYSFFFDDMQLPVTPSKLSVKIKGNNKTLTLVNEGDINFLRSPGLTEISFEMLLPMLEQYSFASEYHQPDYYLGILESYMTEKKPFRFIVSRVSPSGDKLYDTNMKVSLEDYTVSEDATDGFDVTVSINLKQYIDYATKKVTVTKPNNSSKLGFCFILFCSFYLLFYLVVPRIINRVLTTLLSTFPSELSKHISPFTATFPPGKNSGSLTQFVFWFVTGKLAEIPYC